MNAISKRLLSWLCVIAMVLSLAPVMDLSNFAVETNAAAYGDTNLTAADLTTDQQTQINTYNSINNSDTYFETECLAKNYCPVCGNGSTWTELTDGQSISSNFAGHYYIGDNTNTVGALYMSAGTAPACLWLKKDVTTSDFLRASGTVNIFGDGAMTATSSNTSSSLISVRGGTVSLCGGKFVPTAAQTNGAVYFYTGGTVNMYAGATIGPDTAGATACLNVFMRESSSYKNYLNVYGGTIRNGVTSAADKSGNVTVSSTGTFKMYGGTITGGTYVTGTADTTGGNVYVTRKGVVNMYGGTIQNGDAAYGGNVYLHGAESYGGTLNVSGTAKISGGGTKTPEGTYSTTNGGNVYVSGSGAKLTMTGGTITGGAASAGGNVYTTNSGFSTFELQGGTVTNGDANNGGNVYAYGVFEMSQDIAGVSTAIAGGTAAELGGNLYLRTSGRTYEIKGGTIVGDVYANTDSLKISGATKIVTSDEIDGETVTAAEGLKMSADKLVDISGLNIDAKIVFTADLNTPLAAAPDNVQALMGAGCFDVTGSGKKISVVGDQLVVEIDVPAKPTPEKPSDTNWEPVEQETYEQAYKGNIIDNSDEAFTQHKTNGTCPKCGEGVTWTELTDGKSISSNFAGHYYIGDNTNTVGSLYMSAAAGSACLWLKKDVATSDFLRASADINIFGDGAMTATSSNTSSSLISVRGGTVNLYGGKFVPTAAQTNGAVYFYTGGTVNMYAGATIGPDTAGATACLNVFMRESSSYNNYLNVYGGTIQNGVTSAAGKSGNVTVSSTGTFKMYGGTITGGTYVTGTADTTGGNIWTAAKATVNIYGGTIENGEAANGGNIYVNSSSTTLSIHGGIIKGGEATGNGGNIYSTASSANHVYLYGGTITAGNTNGYGGNVYAYGQFTMSKDYANVPTVISEGEADNGGGNLYVRDYATVINGGTITGGVNTGEGTSGYKSGGNVFLRGGSITMNDGTITGGECPGVGANVYITQHGATFDMNGGVISRGTNTDGSATIHTANVQVDKTATTAGVFNLKQGVRYTEADENGNVFANYAHTVDKDGYVAMYATNAGALAAYGANVEYITLVAGENDVTDLGGKSIVLNLNGQEPKLTGNGKVQLIDTANHNFETVTGKVTIEGTGVVVDAYDVTVDDVTVGERRYITIQEEGAYSAHYIKMGLTGVALRTNADGLYYEGQFQCDDVLADRVEQFGLAVSAGETKPVDLSGKFSIYGAANFEPNAYHTVTAYGVSVFGILKTLGTDGRDGATNASYLEMQVHANPYLKIDLGDKVVTVMACKDSNADKFGSKTLLELVRTINGLWSEDYKNALIAAEKENAVTGMLEFKARWTDATKMGSEGLAAMEAATVNIA